ncbi:hypothetical protein EYF80_068072 [Liparis tanakae]|uniref:Uncharacterized protein n=1 Tax=Liparis tanakae TaxID=230148 RepID=A0A4Z2DZ69_9TELE|nr:hypothetical protein EYF80_068072 [Liparis tanakae]
MAWLFPTLKPPATGFRGMGGQAVKADTVDGCLTFLLTFRLYRMGLSGGLGGFGTVIPEEFCGGKRGKGREEEEKSGDERLEGKRETT